MKLYIFITTFLLAICSNVLSDENTIYVLSQNDVGLLTEILNNNDNSEDYDYYLKAPNYKAFAVEEYAMHDAPAWAFATDYKSLKDAKTEALMRCKKYANDCVIILENNKVVHSNLLKNTLVTLKPEIFIKPIIEIVEDEHKELNKNEPTIIAQVPEINLDIENPIIEIEDYVKIYGRNFEIKGKVLDKSKVYIEMEGNSIPVNKNEFTLRGYTPIGKEKYEITAIDQWGNETIKNIVIERVVETVEVKNIFDELNPTKIKSKTQKNRIALVIGIEQYENISNANFAKRDAQIFIDYVETTFGVPLSNIKYLFNENANQKSKFEIRRWLKKNVHKNTEVYLFFSGHGIALNEGKDLYLLANDTISDYVEETSFSRNDIFNDIAQYNPKKVVAFLDTCYSGAGRADGEMLLAMAKGLVVVNEEYQQLPNNFTLFTAASAQESAWSLPEAKHGTFSYFLMKGLEGDADLNSNKEITNGELQEYLLENVGRYARQQQTPQMIGDPNQVLVQF